MVKLLKKYSFKKLKLLNFRWLFLHPLVIGGELFFSRLLVNKLPFASYLKRTLFLWVLTSLCLLVTSVALVGAMIDEISKFHQNQAWGWFFIFSYVFTVFVVLYLGLEKIIRNHLEMTPWQLFCYCHGVGERSLNSDDPLLHLKVLNRRFGKHHSPKPSVNKVL